MLAINLKFLNYTEHLQHPMKYFSAGEKENLCKDIYPFKSFAVVEKSDMSTALVLCITFFWELNSDNVTNQRDLCLNILVGT